MHLLLYIFFLFSIVTVGWSAVILILLTFTIDTNIPNKKKVSFGRMLERESEKGSATCVEGPSRMVSMLSL